MQTCPPHNLFRTRLVLAMPVLVTLALSGCMQLGSFSAHDEPPLKATKNRPVVEQEEPIAEAEKAEVAVTLDTTDDRAVRDSLERMMDGWPRPKRRELTQAIGRCITASGTDVSQPESIVLKPLHGMSAPQILAKAEAIEEAEDAAPTARNEPDLKAGPE